MRLRPVEAGDFEACVDVLYRAFADVQDRHHVARDFPDLESARSYMRARIGHPHIYGVVAEADGKLVGSNFLREYNAIRGVGPISVDPAAQAHGVGRVLMKAAVDRARGQPGVRLVQEAVNGASLALYASLGFEAREPLVLVRGQFREEPPAGYTVRPVEAGDRASCAALCERVHGFARAELWDNLERDHPLMAVRAGRVVAYVSAGALGMGAHGVGETEADLCTLLLAVGAATPDPLSLIVPTRRASFFRWCLSQGLRALKPLTLMTIGAYQEPTGAYFPSIAY